MPPLSADKADLYLALRTDVASSGARVLLASAANEWPQIWTVTADGAAARVRVYLWNVTYDRARGDYKFQITGIPERRFAFSEDARTIILGYDGTRGLYLAADADSRRGPFGSSPAIQTTSEHLDDAERDGLKAFEKQNTGEIAVVVRRDMMATYLLQAEALHELGRIPGGLAEINVIAKEAETRIDPVVLFPRDRTAATVMRAVRSGTFRRRVLTAYEHRCCACDLQLDLVEAAHIVPAGSELSSDDTRNGLCLCSVHHSAYDDGLLGIRGDYSLVVSPSRMGELAAANRDGGRREFTAALRSSIRLPTRFADHPEPTLLEAGLDARGWANPR